MKKIICLIPFVLMWFYSFTQKKARTKLPIYVCDSVLFKYTAQTNLTDKSVTYRWSRAEVAGIANVAASGNIGSIAEYLDNTTSNNVLVKYAITLNINGCDHTDTLQVIVHPTPRLSSVKEINVCDSSIINYTPQSLVVGASFRWTRPEMSGIKNNSSSGLGENREKLIDAVNKITKVPLFYESIANGCVGNDTVWVSVIPRPFGSLVLTPKDTILSGQEQIIAFKTTDTIQLLHRWSFGDGRQNSSYVDSVKYYYNGKKSEWKTIENNIVNRFGCERKFTGSIFFKGDPTIKEPDTISVMRNYTMAIYPVPYTTDLFLKYTLDKELRTQLTIHDLAGRIILTQPLTLRTGNQIIRMPVERLTKGVVYVLRIRAATFIYEDKFYKK